MPSITSRAHPLVKRLAALHDAKARRAEMLTLAEGIHLAGDALAAGVEIRWLVAADDALDNPEIASLLARAAAPAPDAPKFRVPEIVTVTRACLEKISGLRAPEGIIAVLPLAGERFADYRPAADSRPSAARRWLVAVGVQDPGNAGALARVAEAAGADGCFFAGGADPSSPKFLRAAMGSAFRLPCPAVEPGKLLESFRENGTRLLLATPPRAPEKGGGGGSVSYERADYRPPVALCVGAEGTGLPAEWLEAGQAVHLPMAGAVESLNVAVAAGIWLYEARRVWY